MDVPSPIGRPEPAPEPAPYRDDAATTIKMPLPVQPIPYKFSLIVTPDGAWSSLTRKFREGEVVRCGLCPAGTCCADEDNECHLMFEGAITDAQAPLYSSIGLARSPGRIAGSD